MELSSENIRKPQYWLELPFEVAYQSIKAVGNAALELCGLPNINEPTKQLNAGERHEA